MTTKPVRLSTSAPEDRADRQAVAAQVPSFPVSLVYLATSAHHHSGTGNIPRWAAQAYAGPETPDAAASGMRETRR